MAKKTQLSLIATPGMRYSFTAKSESVIYGLYNFIAKNKTFNFDAKTIDDFNFNATPKTFNFNAKTGQ